MRRRAFVCLIGGAAAWPVSARAQQPVAVVGFLHDSVPEPRANLVAAFREGLSHAGYIEGRNLKVEYRWARDAFDQLPALASELVNRQVAVIAAFGGVGPALAAKAATNIIPIVFQVGADPVKLGLVDSLNRPGGNATGVSYFTFELGPKRLGLLMELIPRASDIFVLVNPKSAIAEAALADLHAAASAVRQQLSVLHASNNQELYAAFPVIAQKRAPALLIVTDAFFFGRRVQLATLTARYGIPAIYSSRDFAEVGGLMSYGVNLIDNYREVARYVGRILKGEKPADLPVVQPTKFEFVINLGTAKALGLEVPPALLASADEVIE